ncbi:MAG: hypothetical protein MK106_15100 [Mariniblastus sp.]|nr:hypothetical protein [Mariniblastus sp.]
MQRFLKGVLAIGFIATVLSPSALMAHTSFKKELAKKYPNMKISCSACHVDKKPKSERNELGKLFFKDMKSKNISATYKSKKGDDRKAYVNDVMNPAFNAALKKIQKQKNKEGKTYDELIKSGEMPGITKKEEPKAAAGR